MGIKQLVYSEEMDEEMAMLFGIQLRILQLYNSDLSFFYSIKKQPSEKLKYQVISESFYVCLFFSILMVALTRVMHVYLNNYLFKGPFLITSETAVCLQKIIVSIMCAKARLERSLLFCSPQELPGMPVTKEQNQSVRHFKRKG